MNVQQYKTWHVFLHSEQCIKTDEEIEVVIKASLPRQVQSLCQGLEDLDEEFESEFNDELSDLVRLERDYQNALSHMFESLVKIAGGVA